jgi:hypothetical protein
MDNFERSKRDAIAFCVLMFNRCRRQMLRK